MPWLHPAHAAGAEAALGARGSSDGPFSGAGNSLKVAGSAQVLGSIANPRCLVCTRFVDTTFHWHT